MAKLLVRLFVLLVLGTISSSEAVGRLIDNVYQSAQVYQRVTVTEELLHQTAIETGNIPGVNNVACLLAATAIGWDAFVYDGSCTGYELVAPFLRGTTGGLVMFVREDLFAKELQIINLDDYPYENTSMTEGYSSTPIRRYMMSSFINPEPSNRFYIQQSFEERSARSFHFITRENEDTFRANLPAVNFRSCITNSTDGVSILVATLLYSLNLGIGYFLNECGNAIQIPKQSQAIFSFIYSHEGLGCVDNPNEVPDECTVTFANAERLEMYVTCQFSDPELEDGCPGFNMTGTGWSLQSDKTTTVNSCTSAGQFDLYGYDMYTITLLKHRSTQKSGFGCYFFKD